MACRPGEENVATLFGDVHYFYGPPTEIPPHHRFDKGSYVYLFENANDGRARIEVANHPGTEEQDAFDGFLDHVHVHYSYRHHCMVSLTVGAVAGNEEWHLPTYDPRNENKYHYKLHSLDIYFWTQQDAFSFVNGVRRVLPPNQIEVLDEPGPPPRHSADVSDVVQKLEKAAIADADGSDPAVQAPPPPPPANGIPSFAGPPLSAVSADTSTPPPPPQNFAPIMAYNPAAPAAPEQIQAREKTPPPEDGDINPLHARLTQDAATPFSPGLVSGMPSGLGPLSPGVPPPQFQAVPGAPSFPGPPVGSPGFSPQGFGSLGAAANSPHPGLARAATMPAHGMPSPAMQSPYGAQFPVSPGFPPPPPGAGIQQTPTPPHSGAGIPPPPPGGYSNYNYATQQVPHGVGSDYSIHSQSYKPTEGEMAFKYQPKKEPKGRLEENAGRLERGVSGMLKKFEKKFG